MKHTDKQTLPAGHARRLADARCAYRKMTAEQRAEFVQWVAEFEAGEAK